MAVISYKVPGTHAGGIVVYSHARVKLLVSHYLAQYCSEAFMRIPFCFRFCFDMLVQKSFRSAGIRLTGTQFVIAAREE